MSGVARTRRHAAGEASRPLPPPIWYLALCSASGVIGLTVLTPLIPLIRDSLQTTSSAVQQLLTCYLFALAAGQLIWGPLSDRFGRRPILLVGAVLFTLGGIAVVLFNDIGLLVIARTLQGIGGASILAMARAMVNDAYERTEAARQMSTISMILSVAPALSLAFSGWLAEQAGWKSTITLLVACGILTLFLGLRLVVETHQNRPQRLNFDSIVAAYSAVLRSPVFNLWTVASGMQVGIFFCLNAFLAYQYQRNGYSVTEFGLWFALTPLFYLIGNTFNRSWFVHKGIELAALTGCVLSLISGLSMFATQALGYTHALSLALPCCLFGFANGIVVANTTVGAIAAAGEHRGTGTGIVGAAQMATGGVAGALIVALGGAQHFSVGAGVVIAMACLSVLAMLTVYKHRPVAPC